MAEEKESRVQIDLIGIRALARELRHQAANAPARTVLMLLALGLDSSFTVAIPMSFRFLVDHALKGHDDGALTLVLSLLAGGAIIASAAGIARDYLWARYSVTVLNGIRSQMFDQLTKLSVDFFAKVKISDIMTLFSSDLGSIDNALSGAAAWALIPLLDAITSMVFLFLMDWRLALVASLTFPISLLGPRLVIEPAARASHRRKADEAALMGVVHESVVAHAVVRAFSLQLVVRDNFDRTLANLERSSVRMGLFGSLLERSSGIGTLVLQVLVLGVGARMAFAQQISIGTLAAFLTLFLTLSLSVGYLSQYFPRLLQATTGMGRIEDFQGHRPSVDDERQAGVLPQPQCELCFEDVSFDYVPGHRILDQLSFRVPIGASVAFVGPSGSGKSTVLSLMMRFHDPQEGRILIDETDIRGVRQSSLRGGIGVVFQETILFDTTVRENIRMGRVEASDGEVEAAARDAEIHDAITALPLGYDTPVGERGSLLSGGQRQRVGLARALLRDPEILLLDEATSALDAATEAAIGRTLASVSRGRTVINVTHRLPSIVDADLIFLMQQGRLVEEGQHEDLLQRRGAYAELWRQQSGFQMSADGETAEVNAERLSLIPLLAHLEPKLLLEIANRFISESITENRVVMAEGDPGRRFYLIVRGRVQVSRRDGEGHDRPVAILQSGDHFGEIALLSNTPRNATIRTITQCLFLTLERQTFLALIDRVHGLREAVEQVAGLRQVDPLSSVSSG